jgi:phospholipid N-methyltransferase
MNDLERMEKFYKDKDKDEWSLFNCYPLFVSFKQKYILSKIFKDVDMYESTFLDIGAGEGNFILTLMQFGLKLNNITAVEYLKNRFDVLQEKLPNIKSINDDFLNIELEKTFDIISLMAVLTSIVDNEIRYKIVKKSLKSVSRGGMLVIYDCFDENESYLSNNYRKISLTKIKDLAKGYNIEVFDKVYLKSKYSKGLCKIKLSFLIPFFESLKIFNDNCSFVVIRNEK